MVVRSTLVLCSSLTLLLFVKKITATMDERMRCVISDIDYCRDDSLLLMVAVLHKLSVFSLSLCVSVCVCVCRQPWYYGWGFNLPRGQALLDKWNQVPDNTDILVTHCPPLGETLITEHTHARARTYTHTHTHTHTHNENTCTYIHLHGFT